MLVQLPEEQTQEIQQMIGIESQYSDTKVATDHYHHFKEDIGADSTFLNKKTDLQLPRYL